MLADGLQEYPSLPAPDGESFHDFERRVLGEVKFLSDEGRGRRPRYRGRDSRGRAPNRVVRAARMLRRKRMGADEIVLLRCSPYHRG